MVDMTVPHAWAHTWTRLETPEETCNTWTAPEPNGCTRKHICSSFADIKLAVFESPILWCQYYPLDQESSSQVSLRKECRKKKEETSHPVVIQRLLGDVVATFVVIISFYHPRLGDGTGFVSDSAVDYYKVVKIVYLSPVPA